MTHYTDPTVIRTKLHAVQLPEPLRGVEALATMLRSWAEGTSFTRGESREHAADATLFLVTSWLDYDAKQKRWQRVFLNPLVKIADMSLGDTEREYAIEKYALHNAEMVLQAAVHEIVNMPLDTIIRSAMYQYERFGTDAHTRIDLVYVQAPRGQARLDQLDIAARALASIGHDRGARYLLNLPPEGGEMTFYECDAGGTLAPLVKLGRDGTAVLCDMGPTRNGVVVPFTAGGAARKAARPET